MISFGLILILLQEKIQKRRPGLVVSRYEFNRKNNVCSHLSNYFHYKKLPTPYTLPEDLDTNGQVLISQLKSLDFKEN
ncbi:type II toxin-antitoxin system PemK/MazF family toxin [Enterococcus faecium]|uniref:type II toxin-antitoxin system PemK/MazF family toxin n=1 Tax=Enterococcus faecium TaxID=1352 RepID=UPI00351E3845